MVFAPYAAALTPVGRQDPSPKAVVLLEGAVAEVRTPLAPYSVRQWRIMAGQHEFTPMRPPIARAARCKGA